MIFIFNFCFWFSYSLYQISWFHFKMMVLLLLFFILYVFTLLQENGWPSDNERFFLFFIFVSAYLHVCVLRLSLRSVFFSLSDLQLFKGCVKNIFFFFCFNFYFIIYMWVWVDSYLFSQRIFKVFNSFYFFGFLISFCNKI